jgi:hypothetical protein
MFNIPAVNSKPPLSLILGSSVADPVPYVIRTFLSNPDTESNKKRGGEKMSYIFFGV